MNVNNLTTLIISLMVCGLVVGATVPMITAISNETIVEEYNSTDDASWIRMAYGTADYDLEYTLADDTITVGTQSGTADDMILYADEKSCVMSVDGEFVIVNGYIENPEVIKADTVTVTRSAGAITITDGTDTIVSADAPAWAYYPAVDGTYSFFDASVEGVKVKPNQNMASVGSFAGVMAYNNFVVAPYDAGSLGMTQDAVITDNVIDFVRWAVGVVADDLSLTPFEPGSITIQPLDPSIIDDSISSGSASLMAVPTPTYTYGDWGYEYYSNVDRLVISSYSGAGGDIVVPSVINHDGVDKPVKSFGKGGTGNNVIDNTQIAPNSTITFPDSITTFSESCLQGCSNIIRMNIPDSATTIQTKAFMGCSGLTGELVIPESVTTIGERAFSGCTNLESIKILGNITTIGQYTFNAMPHLSYFKIPNTVTSIGTSAFYNSGDFGTIIIPESMSSVGNSAFSGTQTKNLINLSSSSFSTSSFSTSSIKEVLNLGDTAITTTSYGLNADEVRDDIPALGYIAPLSNTVIVQKEGAIFDVLSLLPLVAGIGLLMVAVIYALEKRYV